MFVIVQAASGESRSQAIVLGIVVVEADELGARPFVDAILEGPFGSAVASSVPVVATLPERDPRVGAESDSSGLKAQGELPAFLDEVAGEIFVVVMSEVETASLDDRGTKPLDIFNVVKGEPQAE
jgi:hypothetical protein